MMACDALYSNKVEVILSFQASSYLKLAGEYNNEHTINSKIKLFHEAAAGALLSANRYTADSPLDIYLIHRIHINRFVEYQ